MNERTTDNGDERLPNKVEPENPTPMLAAEIIVSQDRPSECTIFPPDATEFERLTTWIRAKRGRSSASKTCDDSSHAM